MLKTSHMGWMRGTVCAGSLWLVERERQRKAMEKIRLPACHGPVHSNQVPSDVPHVECLMHNTKFTYLKLFEVPGDFDLAEKLSSATSYT